MWIRRIIVLGLLALLLGGGAFAAYKVYRRGEAREGLLDRARSAARQGRIEEAESLFREVLRSDPGHVQARELLLDLLYATGRTDQADRFCTEWLEVDPAAEVPRKYRVQIAIGEGRTDDAAALARSMADKLPEFSYSVLATLTDFAGVRDDNVAQRMAAAETAENLVGNTMDDEAAADALLLAASIQLEVAAFEPKVADRLRRRGLRNAEAASAANEKANQTGRKEHFESRKARIGLLSENPEDALMAADALRRTIVGNVANDPAHLALALFHMRRSEWTEALSSIRQLRHPYSLFRCLWWLNRAGQRAVALQVLETPATGDLPPYQIKRLDLLLGGSAEEKAAGLKLAAEMARQHAANTGILFATAFTLCRHGEAKEALRLLEETPGVDVSDTRLKALIAAVATRQGGDPARNETNVQELMSVLDLSSEEGRQALRLLGLGGGELVGRVFDAQIEKGGEAALNYRLQRVVALGMRARAEKDEEASRALRERSLADLKAILESPDARKGGLMEATDIALLLGAPDLAGRMLARAITMEGPPEAVEARPLELSMAMPPGDFLRSFSDGISAGADASPSPAYLRAIAAATANRCADIPGLIAALEAAAAEPGSRLPSLRLAGMLAFDRGDHARAEAAARRILEEKRDDWDGRFLLGGVFLVRKEFAAVLELHGEKPDRPLLAYRQCAGALLGLGRKDDALRTAKQAAELYPSNPFSSLLLAQVYLQRGEEREALRVLSLAPPAPESLRLRGRLLLKFEQFELARQTYESLLVQAGWKDREAWAAIHECFRRVDRAGEFMEISAKAIGAGVLNEEPAILSLLHILRAKTFEQEGRIAEALKSCEEAIALDPKNWNALNDAAWHIAQTQPSRIADARGYIDRAMELATKNPAVLDTAARVRTVQGDHAGALRLMDEVVRAAPLPRYLLHRAEVLLDLGNRAEARTLLERVMKEAPGTREEGRAKELLLSLDE
jgi:tetratricopeptide (TPR) repeat protein